jgi:hypothetical protein
LAAQQASAQEVGQRGILDGADDLAAVKAKNREHFDWL